MDDLRLIKAVKDGDEVAIDALILSKELINQTDEQGWTPLCWAAGKGSVSVVKKLLENGADALKVGRDQRTPYEISLAAGHVEVARLLRETPSNGHLRKAVREYCKAYPLSELRKFLGWKEKQNDEQPSGEDDYVFVHQDLTVTRSMWHNEDIVFNQLTPEWEEFCVNVLNFKVPDDLDLIVSGK
jgi:ankyrin repeat protein